MFTQEEKDGLLERIGQLEKIVDSLKKQPAKAAETPAAEAKKVKLSDLKELEYEGKTYKWGFAAFHVPGYEGRIKAAEAATDEAIIKAILAIKGQSILIEQH